MKKDIQGIVGLLRDGRSVSTPDDRRFGLRIGAVSVPAGTKVDLSFSAVGGISLIQDALIIGAASPDRNRTGGISSWA